jgi:hypothetical protein
MWATLSFLECNKEKCLKQLVATIRSSLLLKNNPQNIGNNILSKTSNVNLISES